MTTTDIDECSINAQLCAHGQCINYPGGYRCECDMGFTTTDKERTCVGTFVSSTANSFTRYMVHVIVGVHPWVDWETCPPILFEVEGRPMLCPPTFWEGEVEIKTVATSCADFKTQMHQFNSGLLYAPDTAEELTCRGVDPQEKAGGPDRGPD